MATSPQPSTATPLTNRRSGTVRKLVLLVALAVLANAPSAHAASRLVIRGAGFGHGIGMSQYGAYGLSLQGVGYQAILARYYTGTTLAQVAAAPEVRVLLQGGQRKVTFSGAARLGTQALDPAKTYNVVAGGSGLVLRDGTTSLLTTAPPLRVDARAARPPAGAPPARRRRAAPQRDLTARPDERALPRCTRAAPGPEWHQRDQRGRPRGLRPRRRVRREPVGVAARGAQGAGGRGTHVRDHLARGVDQRRLRPVRRHALADVQGRGRRAPEHRRGRRRDRRPGRHLRRPGGHDVLLLDLRRPHRERRELVRRLGAEAVAEGRRRPLRRPLPAPSLEADLDDDDPGGAQAAR